MGVINRTDLIDRIRYRPQEPFSNERIALSVRGDGDSDILTYCPISGAVVLIAILTEDPKVATLFKLPKWSPRSVKRWYETVKFALATDPGREIEHRPYNHYYESVLNFSYEMRNYEGI